MLMPITGFSFWVNSKALLNNEIVVGCYLSLYMKKTYIIAKRIWHEPKTHDFTFPDNPAYFCQCRFHPYSCMYTVIHFLEIWTIKWPNPNCASDIYISSRTVVNNSLRQTTFSFVLRFQKSFLYSNLHEHHLSSCYPKPTVVHSWQST